MGSRLPSDFHGSDEKDVIRRLWDRPVLEEAALRLSRPLSYLGLPGPAIEDLLTWKDLLGVRTGVELLHKSGPERKEDLERHRRLYRNLMVKDLDNDFQLLRGEIEDIILDTTDVDGKSPLLNDGQLPHRMRFRYDLINLDFLGGVGYRDRQGESKRVRAIKKLFERQQLWSFVLLLTLNVRDGIGDELTNYLLQVSDRVEGQLKNIVRWYASRQQGEKEYKLKAIIPLFIQLIAESYMLSSHAYPPVAYNGTGQARMVHFAFSLTHMPGNLQAFSKQTDADLLNLPLICIQDGGLKIADKQHDGYDFTLCGKELEFLPPETRCFILAGVPSVAQKGIAT